jgi:hypothetical protein
MSLYPMGKPAFFAYNPKTTVGVTMNGLTQVLISSLLVLLPAASLYASDMLLTMPPILATTYDPPEPAKAVNLSAFNDFFGKGGCSSGWGIRDGAVTIKPYMHSWQSCKAIFTGVEEPHTYNMILTIQTEFDGQSPYKVLINNKEIASGRYPLSSSLGCACPLDNWRYVCPDKVINLNIGKIILKKGDVIEFMGMDVYPCGEHGSYAKWHGMSITPLD